MACRRDPAGVRCFRIAAGQQFRLAATAFQVDWLWRRQMIAVRDLARRSRCGVLPSHDAAA